MIGVIIEGVAEVHLEGVNSNYATLCGLDGDDPRLNQVSFGPMKPMIGAKCTCRDCMSIWIEAQKYKRSDFNDKIFREIK